MTTRSSSSRRKTPPPRGSGSAAPRPLAEVAARAAARGDYARLRAAAGAMAEAGDVEGAAAVWQARAGALAAGRTAASLGLLAAACNLAAWAWALVVARAP